MELDELKHYGVKGMKWGIRRTPEQLGHKKKVASGKDDSEDSKKETKPRKKTVSEMSDTELQARIKRLELEKRYRDLSPQKTSKGKAFVSRVVESSAENIAKQATTYAMGRAVNAVLKNLTGDPQVVNPKKGQKDK